jgi:hypothetical protein
MVFFFMILQNGFNVLLNSFGISSVHVSNPSVTQWFSSVTFHFS